MPLINQNGLTRISMSGKIPQKSSKEHKKSLHAPYI